MTDYSQCGEQAIILDFFKDKDTRHHRFLDLGAYDGVTGSNTKALDELGWDGICVEASPFAFAGLIDTHKDNEKVECICGAIHYHDGTSLFHENSGQCSTCDWEHRLGKDKTHEYFVAAITPEHICNSFGTIFQFISLDIEGTDLKVLRNMECLMQYTELICIEHAKPKQEFDEAYFQELMEPLRRVGLTRIVGRTKANTLIARE